MIYPDKPVIYLDNNASTRISPEVRTKISETLSLGLVNPSSQHQLGRTARRILEGARDSLGASLGIRRKGIEEDQLLFTSGGTEANNLAIFGLPQNNGSIVVSAVEHPSVLSAAEQWKGRGREVRILRVDSNGIADLNQLQDWIRLHRAHPSDPIHRIELVSLMVANNETGVLQPIEEATRLCRDANILIHTDAVQALGKLSLSFESLDVDAMSIAAHKIHGPVGIGCLVLRKGLTVVPQLWGGFQQYGLRPGTESVALADGFAVAARLATEERVARCRIMQSTRDRFEKRLLEEGSALFPSSVFAKILGNEVSRLPNTSSIAFPTKDRQSLQMAFDLGGLACSTGSACASGSSQPSHVLKAMGLPLGWIQGGLRFSTSYETTEPEIDAAVEVILATLKK